MRGDAYTWDLGYEVFTELPDGRIFTAYWITSRDGEPVPESACVRYIAGTFFRLEEVSGFSRTLADRRLTY